MAHFVIGWLRNTSYYLFGSGSSGLGLSRRVDGGGQIVEGPHLPADKMVAVFTASWRGRTMEWAVTKASRMFWRITFLPCSAQEPVHAIFVDYLRMRKGTSTSQLFIRARSALTLSTSMSCDELDSLIALTGGLC